MVSVGVDVSQTGKAENSRRVIRKRCIAQQKGRQRCGKEKRGREESRGRRRSKGKRVRGNERNRGKHSAENM